MEHYDWNDGWLFAPVFTPALVQPDLSLIHISEPTRH